MATTKLERERQRRVREEEELKRCGVKTFSQKTGSVRFGLVHFMADRGAHKKMPSLESRAPKLWSKVDRMYEYKQKDTMFGRSTSSGTSNWQ
jgi:hypothetical protein